MTLLLERMTFDQLFRVSDPKRITRSSTVKGPPLEIDSYQDSAYYAFNFKSFPSTTGLRHRGYVKFIKPRNARQKPLQHVDCVVDCTCFGPDTLVLMANGEYKPIKDVRVGDCVYTHRGRVRKVTRMVPRCVRNDESVYRMVVEGFPGSVVVTGEHPFYAFRGNEKCLCGCGSDLYDPNEFKAKNRLWSPQLILNRRFKQGHAARGQAADHDAKGHFDWVTVNSFRSQEWFLTPWLEEGDVSVNADLARLLGYYVAEGCIPHKRGHAVRLTFNTNEWKTLGKDVLLICRRLGFGCRRKVRRFGEQRWLDVTVYSKAFKSFCIEHVGKGSLTKRLSADVMSWDNPALRELFIGAILGDGWLDPEGRGKYLSGNFKLATQVSTILNRLGIRNTISFHSTDGPTYQVLVPRGPAFDVIQDWLWPYLRNKDRFVTNIERLHGIAKNREHGQLRALQECRRIDYNKLVYDISVEEDESFIVHGIAVHNCPDYRYRWAWANKQRQSSTVGPGSLNQAHNRAPRITNPHGKPGLCKHILAAREFIYGLLSSFPSDRPDTADKLDKLTQYAQKRWIDFPGAQASAKEREKRLAAARAARRAGVPVPGVPAPPKTKQPPEAAKPPPLPPQVPPELAVPPAERGRQAPQGQTRIARPPGERGRQLPRYTPPATKPSQRPVQPPKPGDKKRRTESVAIMNGQTSIESMNDLQEAQRIIAELYDEEEQAAAAPPDAEEDAALVPPDDTMAEPPDAEIDADTEAATALGLLGQIRDYLAQLAMVLAPEPEEGAEELPPGDGVEGPPGAPEGEFDEGGGEAEEEVSDEEEEEDERLPA